MTMQKHRVVQFGAAFALIAAMAIAAFGATALARPSASANVTASAKKAVTQPQILFKHQVDMSKVPQASASDLAKASRSLPALYPAGQKAHQAAQQAKSSSVAPRGAGLTMSGGSTPSPSSASVFNIWDGQKDSAATCPYFGGCQPPDMGIAANGAGQVMQSVNTSLAYFNITGTVQSGWPKTAQAFFGVGNPGACDPNGPFMSDPRSWYDPYKNRWGQAELQVEGAFGFNACPFSTLYWIAISNTSNPNGTWTVFAINMAFGGDPTAAADFTQFGFDAEGIFVSANMFNNAGTAYDYAEVAGCNYPALTACNGFWNLSVTGPGGTVLIDTVNPSVVPMNAGNGPRGELFASSFNSPDPFGNDCVTAACHGVSLWSWVNPGGPNNALNGQFVDTQNYTEPPAASQPACLGCIDGGDLRFGGTPFYHAGSLYVAHATGWTNGAAQHVVAIQWFRFRVTQNTSGAITGATDAEDNYLAAGGNTHLSLTYPVMAADLDGDIIMGYDYMGSANFPSINVTSKRVSDPDGTWSGGLGHVVVAGTVNTGDSRWGDYEAMSYNAPYQDNIWFASEYPNPTTGDWNTKVMRLRIATPRA
ncbi:MAG TPA: hypothetical protein VFU78_14235 [Thermomicrobiales bacterium]|nr:hypothetical protein [Thermomicrobiales bacterium]